MTRPFERPRAPPKAEGPDAIFQMSVLGCAYAVARQQNDVRIITLPDNAGHVAIAVFVKSSEKEVAARERAIAEIARAVHDFFLFQPRASS